jgi:predicted TIM-barrel fold metal-dependent hydrolase
MPNDGELVDLLIRICDDPVLLHKILVENPERLYDFGAAE